jgi:hypothetical protein
LPLGNGSSAMTRRRNVLSFRRDDYEAIRALIPDLDLPRSFDQWRKATERDVAELTARGIPLVEVIVDSRGFTAWCLAAGHPRDRATLGAFATVVARQQRKRMLMRDRPIGFPLRVPVQSPVRVASPRRQLQLPSGTLYYEPRPRSSNGHGQSA